MQRARPYFGDAFREKNMPLRASAEIAHQRNKKKERENGKIAGVETTSPTRRSV